ncbi:DNA recombination protein RmuC [Pigmentibacter sp. JX0631]|uniref:DNA recombination protein RmuC n=1 Tax=Pigmentibacter sp. JX0631 TaxID=2976982 RepID=UPI0024682AD6|nr:DNA recombination protein RmuC [Pigmentibacter sp. JX0631]WGL58902.1 DNA recombination protein RmuC [Pigmentibacter sp. JX0631]
MIIYFLIISLFFLFIVIYIIKYKKIVSEYSVKCNKLIEENYEQTDELNSLKEKNSELSNKLTKQENLILEYKLKLNSLESENNFFQKELNNQKDYFNFIKINFKHEFENLANSILEQKTKTINEMAEKNFSNLLHPFKEKLINFEKSIELKYINELNDRNSLKFEIESLVKLNQQMSDETRSLTQALKGDSKFQGDWGEFILEKTLEISGLRKEFEYTTQTSFTDSEGDKYRPDVIIHLPENKHIIIDAKVSLKAYEKYRSSTDEIERKKAIDEHIYSIKKHIILLSEKPYTELKELKTPEFVFLFIPIENAYLIAMHFQKELSEFAWSRKIALVTATTLLTSLKTVASIWKLENQNKNALEIAREGGKLYDKFVGFMEDFEKIGKTFDLGQRQYSDAFNKLKNGGGNIFKRIENLKELGATPIKQIKQEFIE